MSSGSRIFFKKDMAKAILDGRTTTTTRDHIRNKGKYLAVTGDYFHSVPFATIEVTQITKTTWQEVFDTHFAEEGFNSPSHMRMWCQHNGLLKGQETVYLHRFIVIGVPYIIKHAEEIGT